MPRDLSQAIILPAYDAHNTGRVFSINVSLQARQAGLYTCGHLANTMRPLFARVMQVLQGLQPSWHSLRAYALQFSADYPEYCVADYQSAGLGVAIGLFNLVRQLNGSRSFPELTGTGQVRLDGTVCAVRGVDAKQQALTRLPGGVILLTHADVPHLSQLADVLWMKQCH